MNELEQLRQEAEHLKNAIREGRKAACDTSLAQVIWLKVLSCQSYRSSSHNPKLVYKLCDTMLYEGDREYGADREDTDEDAQNPPRTLVQGAHADYTQLLARDLFEECLFVCDKIRAVDPRFMLCIGAQTPETWFQPHRMANSSSGTRTPPTK